MRSLRARGHVSRAGVAGVAGVVAVGLVGLACRAKDGPPTPPPPTAPPRRPEPTVTPWTKLAELHQAPAMTLYGLAADGLATYWRSCAPDGGCAIASLAEGAAAPTQLLARPGLRAFAVDGDDLFVVADAQLLRLPSVGGAPTVLADGLPGFAVAVDGGDVFVTVGDTRRMDGGGGAGVHPGRLVRVPRAGGAAVTLVELEAALPHLAVDGRRVYIADDHGVAAVPRDGGALTRLATDPAHGAAALAVDDDALYFAAGGEVRRVGKDGGLVTVLYQAQIILDVKVRGGVVYAARNLAFDRGRILEPAALVAVAAGGGAPRILAELAASPRSIAVDGRGLLALQVGLGASTGQPDRIVGYPR
jgi:hypothetical protein